MISLQNPSVLQNSGEISKRYCPLRVGILILNWNNHAATATCLRALRNIDYPNYFIVVLDNGSRQPGFDEMERQFPAVQIRRSAVNLGFAGGMNQLMSEAFAGGADYVWMLNSDVVCQADTLSRLVAFAEADPRIAQVSPLIGDGHLIGTYQTTAQLISEDGGGSAVADTVELGRMWHSQYPDRIAVVGTASLYRAAAYRAVGGFDEKFFAYFEDVDLSVRCIRAGFRNAYATDIVVAHDSKPRDAGFQVAPHFGYYMSRNEIIFRHKYMGGISRYKAALWELRRRLDEIARFDLNHTSPLAAQSMLAGVWDGLMLRGGEYSPQHRMPAVLRLPLHLCSPLVLAILRRM